MAKERSEKKEKKEKKVKRSETEGISKKSKKDKKERKTKAPESDEDTEPEKAVSVVKKAEDEDMEDESTMVKIVMRREDLLPFANPLADDKQTKKLLKAVKKANKNKTLKRGVKEVVKAIRKNGSSNGKLAKDSSAVVILAADIYPMDVISHIPVLCEDFNIPYIYVTSRTDLGAAGNTKRPTSVVMISKSRVQKGEKAKVDEEAEKEYAEVYSELIKLVLKAGATVKI